MTCLDNAFISCKEWGIYCLLTEVGRFVGLDYNSS